MSFICLNDDSVPVAIRSRCGNEYCPRKEIRKPFEIHLKGKDVDPASAAMFNALKTPDQKANISSCESSGPFLWISKPSHRR